MSDKLTRRDLLKDLQVAGTVGVAGVSLAAGVAVPALAATPSAAAGGAARPGGADAASALRARSLNGRVDAWRKIFASLRDEEEVCCWYFGTMFLRPQGVPDIPVLHAETIMVYRASAASDGSTRMRWIEIGRFLDPLTGEPAESWLNPFTGRRVPTMRSFITRPGEYHVRAEPGALAIRLEQDEARVESVEATLAERGGRVWLQHTERKVRGVAATATAAEIARKPKSTTYLALAADPAQVDDPACMNAAASGSYSFDTGALPAWAGIEGPGSTIVRGLMQKAATDVPVKAASWKALRALYPQFFAGDKVAPRWE